MLFQISEKATLEISNQKHHLVFSPYPKKEIAEAKKNH